MKRLVRQDAVVLDATAATLALVVPRYSQRPFWFDELVRDARVVRSYALATRFGRVAVLPRACDRGGLSARLGSTTRMERVLPNHSA